MLTLEVPTAPQSSDYTEVQYSYSDGSNDSVLDSWQQLSSADPNYNYIVNHYYYANVYTGSQKLLQDPQVQEKSVTQTTDLSSQNPTVSINYSDNSVTIQTPDGTTKTYTAISNLPQTDDLTTAVNDFNTAKKDALSDGTLSSDDVYGWQDGNGTWHFMVKDEVEQGNYLDYSTTTKPISIGNCELTELTNLTDDQKAELKQVVKDLPDSSMADYFDDDYNYTGSGVYSFQLNGQTYYTTESDLYNSIQNCEDSTKPLENQAKLAYYNSSYIQTKIEETNQALLETDGNGRFTSVKFDNDSVVYSLNTETVTDDAAYQDAMNEYNYKVAQYEKTIADINAKTSIIQQEDRTLELRLKQLDTEQNALSTEMDAVKKVIKDNVESTFKTFSD
jgi:hypothetical protein